MSTMLVTVCPPTRVLFAFEVPVNVFDLSCAVNDLIVLPNVEYRRQIGGGPTLATLRACGLRYARDPDELWLSLPYVIAAGIVDCEDAASLLASEDQYFGWESVAIVYQAGTHLYHVVTARPDDCPLDEYDEFRIGVVPGFRIVDPSRYLGMGRKGS